jgi:hypothetical protein
LGKRGTYTKERRSGGALVNLNGEAEVDEVTELGTPFGIRKRRNTINNDQAEGSKWGQVHVRRLSLGHLHRHDTKRPDINLCVVVVSSDNLRSLPVRRSDGGISFVLAFSQLYGVTKIGY